MRLFRSFLAVFAALFFVSKQACAAPIATGCLSADYHNPYPGTSFLDAFATFDSGGFTPGTYSVFCANTAIDIYLVSDPVAPYTLYSMNVYNLDDPAVGGLGMVGIPGNLDLVEYVLNNFSAGQAAGGTLGTYNSDDIQGAIWTLLEGGLDPGLRTAYLPRSTTAKINKIVTQANSLGNGFVANCSQKKAYVFSPVAVGCGLAGGLPNQAPVAQPLIFVLNGCVRVTLSCVAQAAGQVGVGYSSALTAHGGTEVFTYSITAGALPAGLTLNPSTGAITGVPTVAGTFNFTATVVDSLGNSATHTAGVNCSITIAPAQVTLACVAQGSGQVGVGYSSALTAQGGTEVYTYSITAGSLPAGLTLNPSTGAITGTPTAAGPFNFTATVVDSAGNTAAHTASRDCSITIAPAQVTLACVSQGAGQVGIGYSSALTAQGGTEVFTYSITAGALPAGLTLDPLTGAITGVPSTAGSFNFTATVVDSAGNSAAHTASASCLILIAPAQVTLACVGTETGQVGNPYDSALYAAGGTEVFTYSIIAGALPTGLTLDPATGAITGTPTAAGSFSFTAKVVDSAGNTAAHTASRECAITIDPAQVTLDCMSSATGEVERAYSSFLMAHGGVPPYVFTISAGSLPTGLTLDAGTGEIRGVPSAAGTFNFTATVVDSSGQSGSAHTAGRSCSITINPHTSQQFCVTEAPILNADGTTFTLSHALYLPGIGTDFIFGNAPGQFVDNGDGTATLTGNVYSRSNPTRGWQINVVLTGLVVPPSPAPAGSPKLELPASNYLSGGGPIDPDQWTYQTGLVGTLTGVGSYAGAVLSISRMGPAWQEGVGANGKNHSYGASAWLNVVVIQQPTGGTLTPTDHGDFNLNISTVCPSPIPAVSLACVAQGSGTVGTAYNSGLIASGGVQPYTFSITSGSLPPGLNFDVTTGVISGTPNTVGTFNFTAKVVDYTGTTGEHTASKSCSITINPVCTPLTLGCVTTATGKVGTVYGSNLQVTGGTPAYTFSIILGSLPGGLTLNTATGTISGTPTTAGTFTFTAKVVDSSGAACGGSKSATVCCTITIVPNCPTVTLSCVSNGTGTVGTAYTGSFTVTGGVAPFTFSIISGSLPAGLTLNAATGQITGTPTTAGTFNFTAKVTGANSAACGASASATVCCSIKICPPANTLVTGDTATIGYWQGPNGQALIKSLNGGPNSTQLGNWFASNFPYLFGAYAGADNLSGKSNTQVAAKFVQLFKVTGAKTKAQIMAAALAVYVTNSTLAGNTATASGFNVSTTGTGAKLYNVGAYGAPVGLVNYQSYSVMTLLKQADLRTKLGNFSSNAFNSIFDGINIKGDRL